MEVKANTVKTQRTNKQTHTHKHRERDRDCEAKPNDDDEEKQTLHASLKYLVTSLLEFSHKTQRTKPKLGIRRKKASERASEREREEERGTELEKAYGILLKS